MDLIWEVNCFLNHSATVFDQRSCQESPVVLVSAPGLDLNQVEESSVGAWAVGKGKENGRPKGKLFREVL